MNLHPVRGQFILKHVHGWWLSSKECIIFHISGLSPKTIVKQLEVCAEYLFIALIEIPIKSSTVKLRLWFVNVYGNNNYLNILNISQWLPGDTETFSYLEKVCIPQGIAEAEHKVLFGVLRHSLDNTVLHPYGMLGNTVVVNPWPAISFIKEESASWKTKYFFLRSILAGFSLHFQWKPKSLQQFTSALQWPRLRSAAGLTWIRAWFYFKIQR